MHPIRLSRSQYAKERMATSFDMSLQALGTILFFVLKLEGLNRVILDDSLPSVMIASKEWENMNLAKGFF